MGTGVADPVAACGAAVGDAKVVDMAERVKKDVKVEGSAAVN
jgi:hypothetical protein